MTDESIEYTVRIDGKNVLVTESYDEAFTRLQNEVEWAKDSIKGERKISLIIKI